MRQGFNKSVGEGGRKVRGEKDYCCQYNEVMGVRQRKKRKIPTQKGGMEERTTNLGGEEKREKALTPVNLSRLEIPKRGEEGQWGGVGQYDTLKRPANGINVEFVSTYYFHKGREKNGRHEKRKWREELSPRRPERRTREGEKVCLIKKERTLEKKNVYNLEEGLRRQKSGVVLRGEKAQGGRGALR